MSLAGEFRDLYTPHQPTPEQVNTIGRAALNVSLRVLAGVPDMHPEAQGQFPLLTRTAELLDQIALPSAVGQYGYGLSEATDEPTPEDLTAEYDFSWFATGFTSATSRFAASVAEIALDPSKAALNSALRESYDEERVDRAVKSISGIQYEARHDEELTREWSANFPAFVVIAAQLYENRPANLGSLPYDQGFFEGIHFYPSALGRFALADEMPKI